jgi:hypothetical protein
MNKPEEDIIIIPNEIKKIIKGKAPRKWMN